MMITAASPARITCPYFHLGPRDGEGDGDGVLVASPTRKACFRSCANFARSVTVRFCFVERMIVAPFMLTGCRRTAILSNYVIRFSILEGNYLPRP